MIGELEFDVALDELYGWAELRLGSAERPIEITCSYVADSLGDIVRGFARLASDGGKFEVDCDSESCGSFLITFRRVGDRIEIVAKKAVADYEVETARHKRARFRYEGNWQSSVRTIVQAYQRLLDQYGVAGYTDQWGHEFPCEEWEQLSNITSEV